MPPTPKPLHARFWPKVRVTPTCWLWTATKHGDGYGQIGIFGRQGVEKAHRVAWLLCNGPIPDGLQVLHNCPGRDNPACVNPDHLWLGTHTDNMRDASRKGRLVGGRKRPGAAPQQLEMARPSQMSPEYEDAMRYWMKRCHAAVEERGKR